MSPYHTRPESNKTKTTKGSPDKLTELYSGLIKNNNKKKPVNIFRMLTNFLILEQFLIAESHFGIFFNAK